jgi:hypothetical protein
MRRLKPASGLKKPVEEVLEMFVRTESNIAV